MIFDPPPARVILEYTSVIIGMSSCWCFLANETLPFSFPCMFSTGNPEFICFFFSFEKQRWEFIQSHLIQIAVFQLRQPLLLVPFCSTVRLFFRLHFNFQFCWTTIIVRCSYHSVGNQVLLLSYNLHFWVLYFCCWNNLEHVLPF